MSVYSLRLPHFYCARFVRISSYHHGGDTRRGCDAEVVAACLGLDSQPAIATVASTTSSTTNERLTNNHTVNNKEVDI